MKNTYEKYLNAIPALKEEMVTQLIDWAEINSGTDNLQGLSVMMEKLKSAFQKLSPRVDELSLPPQQCIDKRGNIVERPLGKALHLSLREDAPIQVFLGGHMDTVFSKDSPFQKTAWIDHNTLLGPGVLDMKGGLMILLKSLEILESTPFCKELGWHVLINPDEEIGSPGSSYLFEKYAKLCHVGLIFEPSLPGGSLVNARKGSMNFTVVARGRRAHAGRDFHLGANAISALCQFILEAEMLSNADAGVSINVGKISGGEALNIVPHYASLGMNVRMIHPREREVSNQTIPAAALTCRKERKSRGARRNYCFDARRV